MVSRQARDTLPWARLGIGLIGGYVIANLLVNAAVDVLPGPRGESVFTALLSVFLLETVLLLYAFGVASIRKLLWQFAAMGSVAAALSYLSHLFGRA